MLRPNQPPEACVYPLDEHPDSFHLGVRVDDDLVGVASFSREPMPEGDEPGVRIRGMAVLPGHRGRGIGRAMVERGLAIAAEGDDPPALAWCNARTSAAGYYAKLGFEQHGGEFEIEGIGAHVVMVRRLDL